MSDVYEYGRALFLLAKEDGDCESIAEDVEILKAVLSENKSFIKLLDTPALPKSEKLKVIDSSLGSLNEKLVNLTKILCEKHSVYVLPKALEGFNSAYDLDRGIERAEAISAVPMSDSQIRALREKLEKQTGKTVIVTNKTDPSILGGLKIRYMGIQKDGSVKTRLDRFEKSLKDIVI